MMDLWWSEGVMDGREKPVDGIKSKVVFLLKVCIFVME